MANSQRIWVGGTTGVAQVDTLQLSGTWAGDNTGITTTLTAEDGSTTQTVVTSTAGTTTAARDAHLAALQASTNTLFLKVTWASSSTDSITGTATVAGVPFYAATTEDDSTGAVASDTTTTASAGPNDWNAVANWENGAAIPITTDKVYISGGYSIYYGLNQSAIALKSLHVGRSFTGTIGDPINGYYLRINTNNAAPNTAWLNSGGDGVWIKGTMPTVRIMGSVAGPNSVQVAGDVDNLIMVGPNVTGTVTCAASMVLDNVYMLRCAGARLILNASISSFDIIEMNSGTIDMYASVVDCYQNGGTINVHDAGAITGTSTGLEMRGGTMNYLSGEALPKVTKYGGKLDLSKNTEQAVVIGGTSAVQYDGMIDLRSGLNNVTLSNFTNNDGELLLETGSTPTI